MDSTQKKKPGRPLEHGERLERVQVLMTRPQREAAAVEAEKTGRSISEVIRDWIDRGRRKK